MIRIINQIRPFKIDLNLGNDFNLFFKNSVIIKV